MKNILYSLLMLTAVMSALACGAFACENVVPAAAELPCHEQSENQHAPKGPMLFKDCSNLDLHYYQADKPIQEPVLKLLNYYVVFDFSDSDYLAGLLPPQKSRAPPDRLYAAPATAIYLSTLRIRV
ncbi:hypothetical protein IMCC21906_01107 [Spongiibacter sp. IMCC21906]|jgi:hypothetical protein|uniref:hypothetical protein n=1 Tax=Spongiibacter sp. IMCC21906 TaxID=1620392 RepID=UPI00062E06A4|nr:hypothetical protein [Spongiibacter sp. IMCC21906]AKH68786.1 hypothetical protein IMCC21906_01107 [Spongiibacter sp. IMCC21906]